MRSSLDVSYIAQGSSDICSVVSVSKGDLLNAFICAVDSLIKSITLIIHSENTSSGRYDIAVSIECSTCLEYELAACVDTGDLVALLIGLGISA